MARGTSSRVKQNKLDAFIDGQYKGLDSSIKVMVCLIAIIVPAAILYFAWWSPKEKEIVSIQGQINSVRTEISKALKEINELPALKAQREEAQKGFDDKKVVLPEVKEIPKLLESISNAGKSTGLKFRSFVPMNEVKKEFYAEIPINIEVEGPYHNVGVFFDKLSKLERLVSVNNMKMAQPKEDGQEMVLNSKCQLVTYRYTGTPTLSQVPAQLNNSK